MFVGGLWAARLSVVRVIVLAWMLEDGGSRAKLPGFKYQPALRSLGKWLDGSVPRFTHL